MGPAHAEEAPSSSPSRLQTQYAEIDFPNEKALSDFFWRISGRRFTFSDDLSLAKSRVDRIVERVQAILGMNPPGFRITIKLYAKYEEGNIAAYQHKDQTIRVYADRVTDGIFAHEVAHAVICRYFINPPPRKMQEILAQYVDRHLWEDHSF